MRIRLTALTATTSAAVLLLPGQIVAAQDMAPTPASAERPPLTGAAELAAKPKKKNRRRSYITPGYKPKRKILPTTAVDPPTRPLIQLSDAATRPRVLLDAAGTAHLTWVEKGPADRPGDVEVYCRLPRGAQGCDAVKRWPEAYLPKIAVSDLGGVQPLAVNDDLALVSSRYPYDLVPIPGRPPSTTPDYEDAVATFLDVSVDGGDTFAPRTWIGDLPVHDAAVFGSGGSPSIIAITDTVTGGTSIQTYPSGKSTVKTALVGPGDQAVGGRVVNDGGVPLAAWADFLGNGFLGRWNGSGDPNNVGTWERAPIGPASEPSLASGPAGTFLLAKPGLSGTPALRRVSGVTAGTPVEAAPGDFATVAQDGAGGVYVGSVEPGQRARFQLQRGDGTSLGRATPVATAPEGQAFSEPRFGVHPDGGGVVVLNGSGRIYNTLWATSFGTLAPTGQVGLGKKPGGGVVGPDAVVECGRIAFGAVEMRTEQGCFFNAGSSSQATATTAASGGIRVAQGPVDLNGLWLRPDPGVQIQVDPAKKTIDTTGPIQVQLDAAGGPITLWRGELHLRLPTPRERTLLASFDASQFAAVLKGFPISGRVDVELTDKGVRIPVYLKLPKAFAGTRGDAVLRATVGSGLQLDSLRIEIGEAFLGGPTLRNAVLEYASGQDEWRGQAELLMPPGRGSLSIAARIRFSAGAFREGGAEVGYYPGVPLFKGVYLHKVRGKFGLDPVRISVGGTIGVLPAGAGTFLVTDEADAAVTFGVPWRAEMRGTSRLVDTIPVQDMRMLVTGDGFVAYTGGVRYGIGGVRFDSGLSLAFDLQRELFSGRFSGGKVTVDFPAPVPDVSLPISDVVISNRGIGACGPGGAGFRWAFTDSSPVLFPPFGSSCNLGPIEVVLGPRQAKAKWRRAASAGKLRAASGIRISGGKRAFLHIDGDSAAPTVILIDPKGNRLEPTAPATVAAAKKARVVALENGTQTIVSIRNPGKGRWTVEPIAGSAPITGIRRTQTQPAPRLKTRVVRSNGRVALRYSLRGGTKLGAIIREETGKGTSRVIGRITSGNGTLRIPTGGPAGRRVLRADVTRATIPIVSLPAGRYTAPPRPKPGKPRAVRIKRTKKGVLVRWRPIPRADAQAVVIRTGDGMRRRITAGPKARKLRLTGIDRDDRAAVIVRGITDSGLSGAPARARIRPNKKRG
ncbi:MAG: hypothetical protein R2687_06710 [Candidatus Nanopelagicales bacterium]